MFGVHNVYICILNVNLFQKGQASAKELCGQEVGTLITY